MREEPSLLTFSRIALFFSSSIHTWTHQTSPPWAHVRLCDIGLLTYICWRGVWTLWEDVHMAQRWWWWHAETMVHGQSARQMWRKAYGGVSRKIGRTARAYSRSLLLLRLSHQSNSRSCRVLYTVDLSCRECNEEWLLVGLF